MFSLCGIIARVAEDEVSIKEIGAWFAYWISLNSQSCVGLLYGSMPTYYGYMHSLESEILRRFECVFAL